MKTGSRRQFITTSALAGAGILAGNINTGKKTYIIHQVFFWLKDPSPANQQLLLQGVKSLKKISQVKKLYAGIPASTEKREVVDNSYHVSELLFFNSLEDQAAYQAHPLHQAFISQYSHLWEKVLVYDINEAG